MIKVKDLKGVNLVYETLTSESNKTNFSIEIVEFEDDVMGTINYDDLPKEKAIKTYGEYEVIELKVVDFTEDNQNNKPFIRIVIKGDE